jgi:hypothetical protein
MKLKSTLEGVKATPSFWIRRLSILRRSFSSLYKYAAVLSLK